MKALPREDDLEGISVGELAEQLYPGETIDTALPQPWVDWCMSRGFDPRGQVVWWMNSIVGQPAPLTVEAALGLAALTR